VRHRAQQFTFTSSGAWASIPRHAGRPTPHPAAQGEVLAELNGYAEEAEPILLASDPRPRGEGPSLAPARRRFSATPIEYKRVVFAEITKTADQAASTIRAAITGPRALQQDTRRFLDRETGNRGFMSAPSVGERSRAGLAPAACIVAYAPDRRKRQARSAPSSPYGYWGVHALFFSRVESPQSTQTGLRTPPHTPTVPTCGARPFALRASRSSRDQGRDRRPRRARWHSLFHDQRPRRQAARAIPSPPFITITSTPLQQAASLRSASRSKTCAGAASTGRHITYISRTRLT